MDSAPFPFPEFALVLGVLGALGWRAVTRERREYGRFRRLRTTAARQRTFRRWLIEGVAVVGGLAVVTVLGGWARIPLALADAQAWEPLAAARTWFATPTGTGVAVGAAVAFVVGSVLPILLVKADREQIPVIGDIAALLPRTRGELPYGAALSINAGISEELLFRLGLPALLYAVIGDGVLAFLVAALAFGAMHVYQGPVGVVATTLLGLALAALYVLSGWIWLPIAAHALIDLRSLVLLPVRFGVLRLDEVPRPGRPRPAAPTSATRPTPPSAAPAVHPATPAPDPDSAG